MDKDFFGDILAALRGRTEWETKQDTWYQMRTKGIRRRGKPYPGAPDKHYPLADSMIEKLKPMYVAQFYANDQIAQFQPWINQDAALTTSASEWFDYQLKQNSNFEMEMYCAIDAMLQNGFSVVKVYWDPDKKQLCFCTVDPLHIIVPPLTEGVQSSDWFTHACRMSVDQYERNTNFKQDEDFVNHIKGRGSDEAGQYKLDSQEQREGITVAKEDEILLWEIYSRQDDGSWLVETVAPCGGCEAKVRDDFVLTTEFLPFFKIQHEITDKGWYSPRGVTEIIAPHESALNRLWNNLYQFLDFHGVPTYQQTGTTIVNVDNYTSHPGSILPAGLEPTPGQSAPLDYEQQLQFTRSIAEDRVSVPDLGASQHIGGMASSRNERVTATQINAIVGQSGQSNDLRARLFNKQLAEGLGMSWKLLVANSPDGKTFVAGGAVKQLPEGALHDNYIIMPNCSPDSWNKGSELQKRLALYQIVNQSPFGNKGESLKWLIEASNPGDVKRLYQDPNTANDEQMEDQATECLLMEQGFMPQVLDSDDDVVHLTTMGQRVQRILAMHEPLTPETARAFLMHGQEHSQAAAAKKVPNFAQIERQMLPLVTTLEQIARQPDVATMQPQGSPGASAPSGSSSAPAPAVAPAPPEPPPSALDIAKSQMEKAKTAVAVGNMLAGMAKSGIPISHGDVNTVFRELGLPDLPVSPLPAVTKAPTAPVPPVGAPSSPVGAA